MPRMDSLSIRLNAIAVRIRSDDADFLRYARAHFAPVLVEDAGDPFLEVTFARTRSEAGERDALAGCRKVGRDLFAGENRVVWRSVPYVPGLTLALNRTAEKLSVNASYRLHSTLRSRLRSVVSALSGGVGLRNQFFFELLYWIVYYPTFWLLRRRGVQVLHGGGIEIDGCGVVIAGAQGTGKSTLIAHLLPEAGVLFLSDNMVLFDESAVFSCHEPVRFEERLLSEVPGLRGCVKRINVRVPLGRVAFTIARERSIDSMKAAVCIVPEMSCDETGVCAVTKEEIIARVAAFNALADEVRMFGVFEAALSPLARSTGGPLPGTAALDALLSRARCFVMNIRQGEDPRDTMRAILGIVRGSR